MSGIAPAPAGKSFHALIGSYRRCDRFKQLKPRTQSDYGKVLDYIDAKMGILAADKMQCKDVIRARDADADAVRFANYIVQVLRILMEHAIDKGWITSNPAKGTELLKADSAPRLPWPPELIAAYRAQAKGRASLVFELCLGTGQRIGDVLRMRWNDIQDGAIRVQQGKTGAVLWLPLTARLRFALDATPKVWLPLCAHKDGMPTSYRGAADMVLAVRKSVGAFAYDLHALRHTTAHELAEAGYSDEFIMAVTGHTSRSMVALYAGAARQKARAKEAMGKME